MRNRPHPLLSLLLLLVLTVPAGRAATLDIDDNGQTQALSDGLLMLRYLFGFRGADLVSGAVAPDANRTAGEIETYLADVIGTVDIDGNGQVQALSDGLLMLRYLFGFRGDSLTSGAVDPAASRTTSDIEMYLSTLSTDAVGGSGCVVPPP